VFPPPLTELKIYKPIILLVVLYGCETWSLTLAGRHGLGVFENRVLRRTFGTKKEEAVEGGEDYIMRSFITYNLHKILLR
jgi:hypothetical protein